MQTEGQTVFMGSQFTSKLTPVSADPASTLLFALRDRLARVGCRRKGPIDKASGQQNSHPCLGSYSRIYRWLQCAPHRCRRRRNRIVDKLVESTGLDGTFPVRGNGSGL